MRNFISTAAFLSAPTDNGSEPAQQPEAVQPEAAKPAKPAKRGKAAKPAQQQPEAAKPGKRKPAAPEAAATADPRAAKAERVAAERADINKLYAAFEANRDSVPVKPLSAFKPQATTAHPIPRQPSPRQAAAIAVAFAAAGSKLATGKAVPRVFDRNGTRVCIENGVLRDAVSSGLISVSGDSPETEKLTLRCKPERIAGLIGPKAIKAGNLL